MNVQRILFAHGVCAFCCDRSAFVVATQLLSGRYDWIQLRRAVGEPARLCHAEVQALRSCQGTVAGDPAYSCLRVESLIHSGMAYRAGGASSDQPNARENQGPSCVGVSRTSSILFQEVRLSPSNERDAVRGVMARRQARTVRRGFHASPSVFGYHAVHSPEISPVVCGGALHRPKQSCGGSIAFCSTQEGHVKNNNRPPSHIKQPLQTSDVSPYL